jgi:3-deoxy-manno-octulosonate cytidylyltransferase (CMP-KDO synthetase)
MFTVIIPARHASTRLPGKPLADIAGKPMVVRVALRAQQAGADRVVVATDDERIKSAVEAHGIAACLTRADHPTGTDRLAEAAQRLGLADDAIVVNVQGDEPLLAPALIRAMAELLDAHPDAAIATACHPIADAAEAFNPNVVQGRPRPPELRALFQPRDDSLGARRLRAWPRTAIPNGMPIYRHYGLYAYRAPIPARALSGLPPAPVERFEALEQLRALWHGYRIVVEVTSARRHLAWTRLEDLERVRALFASGAALIPRD